MNFKIYTLRLQKDQVWGEGMGLFGNQIVFKHIEIAQVSLLLLLNQSADSFPNFQSVTEEAIWTRTKSQIGTSSVCETFDRRKGLDQIHFLLLVLTI